MRLRFNEPCVRCSLPESVRHVRGKRVLVGCGLRVNSALVLCVIATEEDGSSGADVSKICRESAILISSTLLLRRNMVETFLTSRLTRCPGGMPEITWSFCSAEVVCVSASSSFLDCPSLYGNDDKGGSLLTSPPAVVVISSWRTTFGLTFSRAGTSASVLGDQTSLLTLLPLGWCIFSMRQCDQKLVVLTLLV